MTTIFANKVRKLLHKKIKGYSNCWIKGDVLIADIKRQTAILVLAVYLYINSSYLVDYTPLITSG